MDLAFVFTITTQLLIAIALIAISALLLKQDDKNQIKDDNPTTLTTRGSYIPLVIGRSRLGAVFMWAGLRFSRKEKISGGKKGGLTEDPEQTIYYESAMHGLCIGPAFKLHRVTVRGRAIFVGPIDRISHPSGSTVDCGREGSFRIYWGEDGQPVDSTIQTGTGLASTWPFLCYVVWNSRRLGTSPNWIPIDYEIEVRPYDPTIASATPYVRTKTLSGTSYSITGISTGSGVGTDYLDVTTDPDNAYEIAIQYRPGNYMQIQSHDFLPDGDYPIHDVVVQSSTVMRVYPNTPINGGTATGTAESYVNGPEEGVNPVFALEQILFETFPHGINAIPRRTTDFSQQSLEYVASQIEAENLYGRIVVRDGDSAANAIGTLMQELGAVFHLWEDGKYRIVLVRQETAVTATLGESALLPPEPEVESIIGDRPVTQVIYLFVDKARNFRDSTVDITDDGQVDQSGRRRPNTVRLYVPITFSVAVKIAERRSQEELAGGTRYKFYATREARRLRAGDVVSVSGIEENVRIISVKLDTETSRVEIEGMTDVFDVAVTDFTNEDGGQGEIDQDPVLPNNASSLQEVPTQLLSGLKVQRLFMVFLRATASTGRQYIHISSDGTSYALKTTDRNVITGGTLAENVPADWYNDDEASGGRFWFMEYGPQFTVLGDDIAEAANYDADRTSWLQGQQIAIIGTEIWYCRSVEQVSGTTYRMRGAIRARYDSDREAHVIGDPVYIFPRDSVETVTDDGNYPGVTMYGKAQPAAADTLPLSDVTAVTRVIAGKGLVPMKPGPPRVSTNLSKSFDTGGDISLVWTYRSSEPLTGAGFVPAGEPYGDADIQGTFTLIFRTTGDVEQDRVEGITTNTYTYTNAALVAAFTSEPSSFKVAVLNKVGSYESAESEITITRST